MRFAFPYSHAYPGGRVVLDDDGIAPPHGLVVFNDETAVLARWQASPEGIQLTIPGHVTAKGTQVPSRDWLVTEDTDGVWRARRPG